MEQGPRKPHCNQKRRRNKKNKKRHWLALQAVAATLNSSLLMSRARRPPTTFSNLYDTPHTSEKTAGITLCRRRRHTFPPRAVVFIRDPLLKAAQEFLMHSNVFATAVASPSKPCNDTRAADGPHGAALLPRLSPPPELPQDSIKLAANNAQRNISIGRNVSLD